MIWRPRSVRMRLTLWYGAALALGLLAYGVFVYGLLWRMLSRDMDRQLEQDIRISEQIFDVKEGRLTWDEEATIGEREMPRIEVFSHEGKLLFRSSNFKKVAAPAYRILSLPGRVEGLPPVTIRAARPIAPLHRELWFLALVLVLGIPLAVLLATAAGYTLARRALSPVDRMAGKAGAITAEQLSERLPVDNPGDELGRLAGTFNSMIARLEQSFEQLRRFTADASHELRTPLTIIRGVGEVGLEAPREKEEYREIIGSMLEEADRLGRLVELLLTLSRVDGGQLRLRLEPTDIAALARGAAAQLGVLAEEKGQTISVATPEGLTANVDAAVLSQALTNLLDNAIKYSPEGGEIRVEAGQRDGRIEITVADPGPGIAAEHHEKVFDRFYRVDKARSRAMGGVGLGLAIARSAVEAHGGTIELVSEIGKGSLFRIILPDRK